MACGDIIIDFSACAFWLNIDVKVSSEKQFWRDT